MTLREGDAVGALVVLPNTSTTRGSFSTWEYASSQPGVVLDYLRLSAAPYPLCFDWGIQPPDSLLGVIPAAIVIFGLLALTVRQLLRRSWQGVCGAWFFLALAPTSSFIAINDLMVEYRMYLPLVAVIAFAVAGGRALCARVGAPPLSILQRRSELSKVTVGSVSSRRSAAVSLPGSSTDPSLLTFTESRRTLAAISRSVANNEMPSASARRRTFCRIGLVVLDGTTDDTTLTASSSAVRSQRIFIDVGAGTSGAA